MKLFKTTKKHKKYWQERKINWAEHYMNWDHPHRFLICNFLKQLTWRSIFEVGMGAGANLVTILKVFGNVQVAGSDISKDAVETARDYMKGGIFKVNSTDNIMMSDNSADICLSDMSLIYTSPKDIKRYLKEMMRIGRNYILLCEFHSPGWWNRMALKYNTGYYAYDYRKLLTKMNCFDIITYKLTDQNWPGTDYNQEFRYIILAKLPSK